MSYLAAAAKIDITPLVYNIGMMGYGMHFNRVYDIETPLYARAFIVQHEKSRKKVALVNAEICFCTIAIKDAVVKKLAAIYPEGEFLDANIMISAQHTHSGPGGYSHHLLYNLTIPGFQPKVFNVIVNGIVEAIIDADRKLQPAVLQYDTGEFAPKAKVAFNRSLAAYNNNPEVKPKIKPADKNLALDRTLRLLRIDTPEGDPMGSINWFGVHTTSLSNDNGRICSDNKGYAADYLERDIREKYLNSPDFVAAFAQEKAGDITPNYKWDVDKKWTRGKYKNDFKSAQYNGSLQYQQALKVWESANQKTPMSGDIDFDLVYVDFSRAEVDSDFADGQVGLHTLPPSQGISFLEGTTEGPGMAKAIGFLARRITNLLHLYDKTAFKLFANAKERQYIDRKYALEGNKHVIIEAGRGKVMGSFKIKSLILPGAVDPVIKNLKRLDEKGLAKRTPWIPVILPLQIITIGELALIGIPAEVTTIAGKRLHDTLLSILKHKGIRNVILSTYSNGYHGYITTPEEYDVQAYEGGHTVYGKWTLPAYQTHFKKLAIAMLQVAEKRQLDRSLQPEIFTEEEIWYGS